ncbi:polysaccharide synthase [Coccidioides immitis H538.4]|uniref:Polysaccharide synthase n=1 Tax=Coccidioides immitis H538.4 TaxID=396776 RepID=A0A0J8S5H1_COCIT|nr:polysaccharide synthase [Coccidioides immitis H538.4]
MGLDQGHAVIGVNGWRPITWTVVNFLKPIPPSGLLDPADVTVVIPCINIYREKLAETLKLILKNDLQKLILVTVKEEQNVVKEVIEMV